MESTNTQKSHGGILFQLEMFRPTTMAAVLAEGLVSKARNMLDASLEFARHPTAPIVVARIVGSVVGDDPAEFWRENADLAIYASQVLPRQCFIYYVRPGEDRREGFIVAQRGQVLVAHDATDETIPEGTAADQWPVGRLCEQMQLKVEDLADAFPDGPRISISLADPTGDDQALLMTLAGQDDEAAGDPNGPNQQQQQQQQQQHPGDPDQPANAPGRAGPPGPGRPAAGSPTAGGAQSRRVSVDDDTKRRAAAHAAEREALAARSAEVLEHLPYTVDTRGVIVALRAELEETEILSKYSVKEFQDGLPEGLPDSLRAELLGRSIDFAVNVDFFSEVFLNNRPLTRADFEANATDYDLGGEQVKHLCVFAPRIGAGTLLRRGKSNLFVSRRPEDDLPAEFIAGLLR